MTGSDAESAKLIPSGPLYIGEDGCRVAGCPHKQEFPGGDDPYCIGHSYGAWQAERDSK